MQDMKFRVSCPEHSKFIQEKLFKLGIEWSSGEKEILYEYSGFLFVEKTNLNDVPDGTMEILYGSLSDFNDAEDVVDMTDHPDWCWPRNHAMNDTKERIARNAGGKPQYDEDPLHVRAEQYIKDNPEVYQMFRRFAFQAINAGREVLSAGLITERIRWETQVIGNDEFKINNDYRAYMARKFMGENPKYGHVFRTRSTKKEKGIE